MIKIFNPLNIDPVLFFRGSAEEISAAQKSESERARQLASVIFDSDYKTISYTTHNGALRILHRSTRPGVLFQLSYIDPDGIPAMHQNFIQTAPDAVDEAIHSRDDLLHHFVRYSNNHKLTLYIA